jgi:hypothetical protein
MKCLRGVQLTVLVYALSCGCGKKPPVVANSPDENSITISEEMVSQLQKMNKDIQNECIPKKGTSLNTVEQIYGKGIPATNSKVPVNVPPDSPYRSYQFCNDGTLFILYDSQWNVSWAYFDDPYSLKNLTAGAIMPLEMRYREAKQRLAQLQHIREEYRRRFEAKKDG